MIIPVPNDQKFTSEVVDILEFTNREVIPLSNLFEEFGVPESGEWFSLVAQFARNREKRAIEKLRKSKNPLAAKALKKLGRIANEGKEFLKAHPTWRGQGAAIAKAKASLSPDG